MSGSLKFRKRQFVHDAIYDAAIDLFSKKGFDETTVEEVADAAGISRRSFFRYFTSKDDLLAQSVVAFGDAQVSAIRKCPKDLTPIDVVHKIVAEVVKIAAEQPRTRQVIAIAENSTSAAQAHISRLVEVENKIAAAFASRTKGTKFNEARPQMLAGLTTLVMSVAIIAWFRGEYSDVQTASEAVFTDLSQLFATSALAARTTVKTVRKR